MRADIVSKGLKQCIERVTLLFNACDEYLKDPENPAKYDIGPRSEDVTVTFVERVGEDGREVKRKRKLSEILADLRQQPGITVRSAEIRHADIRELMLKTMTEARSVLAFLVDLEVLDHNARQNRLFAEELFCFLDELEPGLRDRFLERVREKRMIRPEACVLGRMGNRG